MWMQRKRKDMCVASFFAVFLICLGVSASSSEKAVSDIPDEKWDYVTVRKNAHMFWWLYGADANKPSERLDKPLIMWLQGGPGGSSTGYGNFEELGPLNVDLTPRNTSWTKAANLLLVDNPVGSGFSYVTKDNAYTTNVTGIATDLLVLFKEFLVKMPVFKTMPFYIFCESYGGKMTSAFAVTLYNAIHTGKVACNFQGIALGDSWISPVDSTLSWGQYLYSVSLLDETGLEKINMEATATAEAVKDGDFKNATYLWAATESLIDGLTDSVDVYNILRHHIPSPATTFMSSGVHHLDWLFQRHVSRLYGDNLSALMNGPIRKKLGIIPENVTWGGQSGAVFTAQSTDFMKPVISDVSKLLNYGLKVVVYQGQLDMICCTTGAEMWMKKLDWEGLSSFDAANRKPLYPPSGVKDKNTGAFVKAFKNLELYYIMKAGHMVPADAGEMALDMVKRIITGQ